MKLYNLTIIDRDGNIWTPKIWASSPGRASGEALRLYTEAISIKVAETPGYESPKE